MNNKKWTVHVYFTGDYNVEGRLEVCNVNIVMFHYVKGHKKNAVVFLLSSKLIEKMAQTITKGNQVKSKKKTPSDLDGNWK